MEAIRTKDKIFLATVVPIALAVAYATLWRAEAARRTDELVRESAALVETADFPLERQAAERRLGAAKAELAAEEKVPPPVVRVKADAGESVAARERAVREVFRRAGLSVTSSTGIEPEGSIGGGVLERTGARPEPVCRWYAVRGSYPQVCAALRTFVTREMAVVPDRVEMSAPDCWSVTLWE